MYDYLDLLSISSIYPKTLVKKQYILHQNFTFIMKLQHNNLGCLLLKLPQTYHLPCYDIFLS